MEQTLTDSQAAALRSLRSGPVMMGTAPAGRLIRAGLAQKTGQAGKRGRVHVEITKAGRRKLSEMSHGTGLVGRLRAALAG